MARKRQLIFLDMRDCLSHEQDRKAGLLLDPQCIMRLNSLKAKRTNLWVVAGPEEYTGQSQAGTHSGKHLRNILKWCGVTLDISSRLVPWRWWPSGGPSVTAQDALQAAQHQVKMYRDPVAWVMFQARGQSGNKATLKTVIVDDRFGIQDADIILAARMLEDQQNDR